MRAKKWANTFTPEEREQIIAAASELLTKPDEDGYVDDWAVRLERRAGDPPFKTHEPFSPRNYDLFAALANVRNGRGFAGVYTGDPIVPIDEPRGWPDDADPETLKKLSHEHSQSWLLLAEMQAYDWDQPKVSGGYVSEDFYKLLKNHNPENLYPWDDEVVVKAKKQDVETSVSGGISGGGIVTMTQRDYEFLWQTKTTREKEGKRPYIAINWTRPLRDSVSAEFFDGLKQMAALGPADKVRLVFDFDS